ncbi:hypothetical protein N9Z21_01915 [Gammaproteobacteria bacterium]|nr:hypothetical protein [Gammaproteobacteria bacterium]
MEKSAAFKPMGELEMKSTYRPNKKAYKAFVLNLDLKIAKLNIKKVMGIFIYTLTNIGAKKLSKKFAINIITKSLMYPILFIRFPTLL